MFFEGLMPVLRSSHYDGFSNTFSWEISVADWSKMAVDDHFNLWFETLLPPNNERIRWYLEIYSKGKDALSDKRIEVFLATQNPEFHKYFIQVETAYRFRKPNETQPIDMYDSRSYNSFHSSEFEIEEDKDPWIGLRASYDVGDVENRAESELLTFEFAIKTHLASRLKFQDCASKRNQMFINNFEQFYGEPGDMKMICDGKEFDCHKLLLTSQSPVFKAMFAQDSKEKADNCVTIDDGNPEAIQEFLFFLYHAKLRRVPFTSAELEVVFGLVHLASKYQVELLMNICKDVLMEILDMENVLQIRMVIDKHPELIEISGMVDSFMKENIEEIVVKEGWSEFVVTNPSLVTQLCLDMKEEMRKVKQALEAKK